MINLLITFLYWILSIIDKSENDNTSKIINSYELDGFEVLTDHGWSKITHVHETRPFEIYNIKTSGGKSLDCADNHIVFDPFMNEVFVKDLNIGDPILTSDGIEYIVSKEITNIKVCMTDVTVDNPTHSYYTNDILSHNTTTSGIYLLWYILFNFDKNSLVIADVRKHAVEILDKTKKIFYEIPYFLKPGVYKWNEGEIVMDNGCRIMASATTVTAAISYTFHEILWDEAAHLKPSFMEKFYNNLFPTITAAKAKFMITSTQGGYNLFYRLYKAAEAGDNEYKAFKTDWYEVPEWNPETQTWEKRDEAWRRLQIANYGSEEAFNSQFGTDFDVDVKTLISKKILRNCQQNVEEFINKDLPGVSLSENYYWKSDYDPASQLRKDYILLLGDLAEGVEKDYTNFNICRLTEPGSDKLECIGYYRSNDVDRKDIAKSLMELCAIQCDPNHTLLSFERNTYGELFLKHIEDFDEKNTVSGFDKSVLVKFFNESGTKFEYGVRITRGNKNDYCILFKEDFEKGRIINNNTVFCGELLNFSDVEDKGVWKAAFGHDDSVMSMIQFEAVKKTLQYKLMKQEFDSLASHPNSDTNYNPYSTIYDDPTQDGTYDRFIESGFRSIYDFESNDNMSRLSRLG